MGQLSIEIVLDEGEPYLFGNINFVGNKKYTNNELLNQLGIDSGDVFNQSIFVYNNPKIKNLNSINLKHLPARKNI